MSKISRVTPAMMVVTYQEGDSFRYRLYLNGSYEGDFSSLRELTSFIMGIIISPDRY